MTIDELIPSVGQLSHAEKIRLAQVVLQQLAQEEAVSAQPDGKTNALLNSQHFTDMARRLSDSHNPLKGSVTFEKDILSPIDDDWDAAR